MIVLWTAMRKASMALDIFGRRQFIIKTPEFQPSGGLPDDLVIAYITIQSMKKSNRIVRKNKKRKKLHFKKLYTHTIETTQAKCLP